MFPIDHLIDETIITINIDDSLINESTYETTPTIIDVPEELMVSNNNNNNTTINNNNIGNAIIATAPTPAKRGAVYTSIEELMVCKAFIAASEDSQVGTSQKGKNFKYKMFKLYDIFLIEQEKRDYQRLSLNKTKNNTTLNCIYDRRSPDAVYDRFKLVSHKCSKLLGIESTTTWESGWDQGKFDTAVDYHFEQKWPKLGICSDIRLCFDYLKGKPKWNSFMDSQFTGVDKHNRPLGKKKEKTNINDKNLIKEVVKQIQNDTSTVSDNVIGAKESFLQQAGVALSVYCKAQENQQELTLIGMMSSPDKKEILAMKRDLMLAKMRSEKRKYDAIESIPTSINVASLPNCRNSLDNSDDEEE
jgi:hypothetical protein